MPNSANSNCWTNEEISSENFRISKRISQLMIGELLSQ